LFGTEKPAAEGGLSKFEASVGTRDETRGNNVSRKEVWGGIEEGKHQTQANWREIQRGAEEVKYLSF